MRTVGSGLAGFSGCAHRLSSCSLQALERGLSSCGPRASLPWRVWSSQIRNQTHIPCIGRQILNHGITREVPILLQN